MTFYSIQFPRKAREFISQAEYQEQFVIADSFSIRNDLHRRGNNNKTFYP